MVRCFERYAGILLGRCFLSHGVSFAARWLLRLLHGGSPLDKVAHTTRSCLVGRGRVAAMVSWHDLLGAICVPSGRVDAISPSSSLRLVYVRATVFCLLTARSMLLLSKRLYSGSYENGYASAWPLRVDIEMIGMPNSKLLTIAVPAYNAASYLHTCLDSLVRSGDEVEALVVNDGSKDGTLQVARDYAERYPGIVVLLTKRIATGAVR